MTFDQLKTAMESFGLWEKVRGFYRKDGRIHDFEALEDGIKKYSTSERALILAFTDWYHGRNTVYFNEVIQALDQENIYKLIQMVRQLKGVKSAEKTPND